ATTAAATTTFEDSDFEERVRAALADLRNLDPATATRLVVLMMRDRMHLEDAAQQLDLSPQAAAEIIAIAAPRLSTAFQPRHPDGAAPSAADDSDITAAAGGVDRKLAALVSEMPLVCAAAQLVFAQQHFSLCGIDSKITVS